MANIVNFNSEYPIIEKSDELYSRSIGLIPANTQTMAKGPSQYVNGIAPKYLKRGKGSHVWDVDDNEYLDYNMAIGPISLGYCYPKTDYAIINQLFNGITFSMMHPLEVEVAELIREIIPNAESVRFSKSGADVTSAAIRVARAYTGKNKILCCGYHGWHDWYVSTIARNSGIPQVVKDLTFTFNYNDIDSVINSIDDDTAAIILEPVVFDEPKNNFLHNLAELCKEKNILLIFDEMWTGFRMAMGGAQGAKGSVQGATGNQGAQGAQGATGPPSDKRLKDNITEIKNVLEKTKQIEGVRFVWDYDNPKLKNNESIAVPLAFQGNAIGVIAQQIENILPEIVFTDEDGYKSVQYGLLVSFGVGSVKEQQKRIEEIYKRINYLKEKIGG